MTEFAEWLAASPLNNSLESSAYWIIPTLQIVHILSIAVVMGSMIMVNARLLRAGFVNQTIPQTASRFLPWMWWALAVLLLSGAVLILMEPARTLGKNIFWMKMSAILVAAIMTAAFHNHVARRPEDWTGATLRPAVTLLAGVNLAIWAFIIIAGRWIAYA